MLKDRALIGAVGEQFPEKGKQTEQGRQQRETAVAILNVGGGDDAVQASLADQNMPLLALDSLPSAARLSQAMVRSTTQRLGWTTKPFTRSDRLTRLDLGPLDRAGCRPGRAVKDRALIRAVRVFGEQFPGQSKGKQTTNKDRQQRETAVAILNVGGGDELPCSSKPCVSTRTCRFLPLISLPASKPWLSMRAPLFQRFSHSDCR